MSNDIYPTLMIIYKAKSKIDVQSQEKKQIYNDNCPTLMINIQGEIKNRFTKSRKEADV